jgi:hypothetical protein
MKTEIEREDAVGPMFKADAEAANCLFNVLSYYVDVINMLKQ